MPAKKKTGGKTTVEGSNKAEQATTRDDVKGEDAAKERNSIAVVDAALTSVAHPEGGCGTPSCTSSHCGEARPTTVVSAPSDVPSERAVLPASYGYDASSTEFYFDQFSDRKEDEKMNDLEHIMRLIAADLSEPYSIFTYRYFLQSWPDLCVLCRRKSDHRILGCIVNKIEKKPNNPSVIRGYVAMLAVDVAVRFGGIGSRLVIAAVDLMKQKRCDMVYLETPIDNKGALRLYESLGFVRDKRLTRYYMTGSDAFRLKLWLN